MGQDTDRQQSVFFPSFDALCLFSSAPCNMPYMGTAGSQISSYISFLRSSILLIKIQWKSHPALIHHKQVMNTLGGDTGNNIKNEI